MIEASHCPIFHYLSVLSSVWDFVHSNRWVVAYLGCFTLHVLWHMMWYILICLLAICIAFFGEVSGKIFGPCFNQVISYCWVSRVLWMFWIIIFYHTCFLQIFSLSLYFHCLDCVLHTAEFSKSSLSIISFTEFAFSVFSKESSPNPKSSRFCSVIF